MTATAVPAYEEFLNLYGLTVFKVPPHIPCKRLDHPNLIFTHQNAKMNALIKKIKAIHQTGRPILIGTLSIKESETLAQTLRQNGLDVQVLNAKNDALEAAIIAEAGALGAITISTNMAGRGTDIVLGGKDGRDRAQVKKLGGLFVIGTNLSESLRIDEQLRGRAGRQGDIGATQFFIAMDDELMLRYQFHSLLPDNYLMEQSVEAITDKLMMKRMNQAQRIIENQFFEMRKTLFEYANFIENQRFIFQEERQTILFKEKLPHISTDLRHFILNQYDQAWVEYLLFIEALRQGLPMLRLGGIGARNPLRTFYKDASKHFDLMREQLQTQIAALLAQKNLNAIDLTISKPASTWTYIISDSTYQDTLALSLCDSDNIGWQVDFITAPILLGLGLSKKMKK
jgi:preprotein translocase subunit SecA